jgi:hypothetical protein
VFGATLASKKKELISAVRIVISISIPLSTRGMSCATVLPFILAFGAMQAVNVM